MSVSDWIAFGGAVVSLVSLGYTHAQWKKVKAKIGMIDDYGKAAEVLPAWYTGRMMSDNWLFGLYTSDGCVILIHQILAISDDGKWMDVELVDGETGAEYENIFPRVISAMAKDRPKASIQIANIVAAVDLQSS